MRTVLLITSLLLLILLTSCVSSGTLKIYNRTSYNIYMTVQGNSYTIPGHQELSVNVETGTETIFTGGRDKDVDLILYGETWMMQDYLNGNGYVKETRVKINAGETSRIYCDPFLAAVKINNHSSQAITHLTYTFHQLTYENTKEIALPDTIRANEVFFSPIPPIYQDPQEPPKHYTFQIMFEDGTWQTYGDATTDPGIDEEYIIDVNNQSRRVAGRY